MPSKQIKEKKQIAKESVKKEVEQKEPKKGKVFVYTAKGQLVPVDKLERYEVKKSSKALKEDRRFFKEYGLMSYPYPPESFMTYYESSGYFMRCVDQVAQDVAGSGYRLEKASEDIDENKEDVKQTKEEITLMLQKPNEEDSLKDIIKMLITDWGTIGWWNLELVRTDKATVIELYHVSAHTIKVHKDKKKYCQTEWVEGRRKRMWFKRFGESFFLNDETGEETKTNHGDNEANEMIMYNNYFIRSEYYGTPNILGSIGAVILLISIRDFNISFFENYGVPAALVTLSGEWDEDTEENITDFIDNEIKGTENAHKTLVMRLPEGGGEIKWDPLWVDVKEGHFKIYFKTVRDEVLMAYSMPPYRIGIAEVGALGGSTAPEATKIYIDSIIKSLQSDVEEIFNNKILATWWPDAEDKPLFKFRLILPDTRDVDTETTRACKLFDRGVMSRTQLAQAGGLIEIAEDEGGHDYYILKSYIPLGEETLETHKDAEYVRLQQIEEKVEALITEKKKIDRLPLVKS